MRVSLFLATLALAATLPASAQRLAADGGNQTLQAVAHQYFTQVYFHYAPTAGTAAGLHEFDSQIEDYSAGAREREIAAMRGAEQKLAAIPANTLDSELAADRQLLLNSIGSQLLTLQTIRPWEKNPDSYSSGVTNSVFVLMERPFAPAAVRLRAVVARERQIPAALEAARQNLKNPPRVYTEVALEQIDGIISFFQNDVPQAFAEVHEADATAAFAKSNAAVIAALRSYAAWMKSDLLPRSNGDFRFGADTFRRKLALDEMVETSLPQLLQVAYDDLHHNQAEFARVAREVDASKTPQQVLAELATVHPAPDALLQTFQVQFASLQAYIGQKKIITIPSEVEPVLEETPPFMRATTQASMDPPGPFETHSTKAYFNVTLPEKSWTPAHVAEHMAAFNVGTITSTAVHEAYPGHYVQFLWQNQFPSEIRKVVSANTNVEGWAHYCEQMMLDEGYLPPGVQAGSREAKLIRLGQLQDALLRDARFIVAIRLHTDTALPAASSGTQSGTGSSFTIEQAAKFFVDEGYQSPSIGMLETKRGTADALYLYYTLGKLEILKLRADVQAKQGSSFALGQFHDALMRQGPVPIKVIRRSMLGDDSPVL